MKRTGGVPRRHKLFLGLVLLLLGLCIWPGYLPAARIEPYLFGLPFGLAWIVLCLLAVFAVLVLTFRADMRAAGKGRDGAHAD